jgi:hypothetical protein
MIYCVILMCETGREVFDGFEESTVKKANKRKISRAIAASRTYLKSPDGIF